MTEIPEDPYAHAPGPLPPLNDEAPAPDDELIPEADAGPGSELASRPGGVGDARPVGPPGRRSAPRPMRRDARVGPPPRHPQWMLNQLPIGMMESDFFVRFVSIFQELGNTLLDGADLVEHVADVSVTPPQLLPVLAGWIGVDSVDAATSVDSQRVLVRSAANLLAWRGTRKGLTDYLETVSGGAVQILDSGGVYGEGQAPPGPAWVKMQLEQTGHLTRAELIALVRDEVPAHVRAELWVSGERIWATTDKETGHR